ncbi:MAG TPA: hypothetical protein DCW74_18805 [Alteromonas australica]|uniref:Uncharacterized protein n=1 Tax=Alteromonas australica TaxID=589873 RepID=A0A350P903_9ALTE|nr:hypothetical protein [Alteromonas macleodii]HAW77770.1 hypothetical protein [Alteromonas australica]HCV04582.1 hypothetical protein [Pseudoalteromonas sp.]
MNEDTKVPFLRAPNKTDWKMASSFLALLTLINFAFIWLWGKPFSIEGNTALIAGVTLSCIGVLPPRRIEHWLIFISIAFFGAITFFMR